MELIINDKIYQESIKRIADAINTNVVDGKFHINNIYKNQIEKSDFSIDELLSVFKENQQLVEKFVFVQNESEDIDEQQEYHKGEKPDEDDWDEDLKEEMELHTPFLISSIIYFSYLKNKFSDFESYLKRLRIPHAKKYAKGLKHMYNKII